MTVKVVSCDNHGNLTVKGHGKNARASNTTKNVCNLLFVPMGWFDICEDF